MLEGRTPPPLGAVALEWCHSQGKPATGCLEAELWEVEATALAQLLMTKAISDGSCMSLRVHDLGASTAAAVVELFSDASAGSQANTVFPGMFSKPLQASRLLQSQVLAESTASADKPEAACTGVPEAILLEGLTVLRPVAVRVRLTGTEVVEKSLSRANIESQDDAWGKPLVLVSLGPALAALAAKSVEDEKDTMGSAKMAAALCAALRSSRSDASLRKDSPSITIKAWH
mmetsp:Transcript_88077/g.155384  ORF Transcript_88077/g.155384 Transcript_88077/m.155384 type:complete len:231 (-) Transcript_88077:280-972(-)